MGLGLWVWASEALQHGLFRCDAVHPCSHCFRVWYHPCLRFEVEHKNLKQVTFKSKLREKNISKEIFFFNLQMWLVRLYLVFVLICIT